MSILFARPSSHIQEKGRLGSYGLSQMLLGSHEAVISDHHTCVGLKDGVSERSVGSLTCRSSDAVDMQATYSANENGQRDESISYSGQSSCVCRSRDSMPDDSCTISLTSPNGLRTRPRPTWWLSSPGHKAGLVWHLGTESRLCFVVVP